MGDAAQIRTAAPHTLPLLHQAAAAALTLDRFTAALLSEKLFTNPRQDADRYHTWLADIRGNTVGFLQTVTRPAEKRAWLGIFGAIPRYRRRRIASQLYDAAVQQWHTDGIQTVDVLGLPGNYFAPGLDPRYTAALCFLEKRGFQKFGDCVNLTADLTTEFDTTAEESRLADAGIQVRRARDDDDALLDAFFNTDFGAEWRLEAQLARKNSPPALHLALRDGNIIGFSAHSGQNREWGFFGPMGTTPAARGTGIGRVLLWHCLNDLRAAGHKTALIPWVGPIGFYARYTNCRVDRVFWRYRLTLAN